MEVMTAFFFQLLPTRKIVCTQYDVFEDFKSSLCITIIHICLCT